MRGRLVVCFDGTWNTAEDQTNVSRLYAAIADRDVGCRGQLKFYDQGVGTVVGERVRGGTLGRGLDRNILEGYCWLVNNYHPKGEIWKEENRYGEDPVDGPDDLFLFGFSRGAFTARSLGGMVNRCGILKKDLFRERGGRRRLVTPDDPIVQEAWALYRTPIEAPPYANATTRDAPECVEFRRKYSSDDGLVIKFMGVWDTVGALGIPLAGLRGLTLRDVDFHDTELSGTVELAYHALAVDERRGPFLPSLWLEKPKPNQTVEQTWFPGVHSDVGGGYPESALSDISLGWMLGNAEAAGLALDGDAQRAHPLAPDPLGRMHDSRNGFYKLVHGTDRPIDTSGTQRVHESVLARWDRDPSYRPANVRGWLARRADPRAGRP